MRWCAERETDRERESEMRKENERGARVNQISIFHNVDRWLHEEWLYAFYTNDERNFLNLPHKNENVGRRRKRKGTRAPFTEHYRLG